MVLDATTAELVKITADGGGETDGGGDAGEENNQGQNHLSRETHVVHADHIQQLSTIRYNAKGSSAGSTGISQSTINQSQADCGNNTGVNAYLGQLLLFGDTLGLNRLQGSSTVKHGA